MPADYIDKMITRFYINRYIDLLSSFTYTASFLTMRKEDSNAVGHEREREKKRERIVDGSSMEKEKEGQPGW